MPSGPHLREAKNFILVHFILRIPVPVHSLHGYAEPSVLSNLSTIGQGEAVRERGINAPGINEKYEIKAK